MKYRRSDGRVDERRVKWYYENEGDKLDEMDGRWDDSGKRLWQECHSPEGPCGKKAKGNEIDKDMAKEMREK